MAMAMASCGRCHGGAIRAGRQVQPFRLPRGSRWASLDGVSMAGGWNGIGLVRPLSGMHSKPFRILCMAKVPFRLQESLASNLTRMGFGTWSDWKLDPIKFVLLSVVTASLLFQPIPDASWASEEKEKKKYYTNLEEAREVGERRREEKEKALGEIVTLPSGIKFREIEVGSGKLLQSGDEVSVYYTIYRLNGYYLDSLGYGNEGKNDVGETFKFIYQTTKIPLAAEKGMEGMRVGGRRRILIPPNLGWVNADTLPTPTSSSAERRLLNSKSKPLLFEVDIVKIRETQK